MSFFSKINSPSELLNNNSWFTSKLFTNFGYKEDSIGNDLNFSDSLMAITSITNNPSLKQYFKPVSNQYSLGSCVANGVADALEAQISHRKQIDPSEVEDLSRLFIYWNARNLDTPPSSNVDKGSCIRLAFDSVARYGVPSEKIYPYDINKVNDRPSIISYREAIKNRISKFYRITTSGIERINQIKQALSSGNPVVFGTKIAESFKYVSNDKVVINPGGWYIGGHCMVCTSWSEEKQAFEVRNSWGEDWGCKGYCWMDKNYIASNITHDIWVPTI